MTDDTISPLRRRMIEDMTVRGFTTCTQRGSIAAVGRFTVFLGRSPDQATAEDLRRFQLQMRVEGGVVDDHERGGLGLAFLFRRDAGPRRCRGRSHDRAGAAPAAGGPTPMVACSTILAKNM